MTMENRFLDWDRHTNVEGSNRLMGYQPSSFDNWFSNGNTYKQTIKKSAQIRINMYQSSAPFFVIYKAGPEHTQYWW